MPGQLTVRLPDELSEALEAAAKRLRRKRSEVVRIALEQFLELSDDRAQPADRVRSLLGSIVSGAPDLADRHREHILVSLSSRPTSF